MPFWGGVLIAWYIAIGVASFWLFKVMFEAHDADWPAVAAMCAFFWAIVMPVAGIVFILAWAEDLCGP